MFITDTFIGINEVQRMITLQQLKYFRELAQTEQLTRTAEKLFITQTTLSNTIKNLETQLGVKLFDRVGRTLRLNEVGRKYLTYVSEALDALENAQIMIDDHSGNNLSVSVAMTNSNIWSDLVQGFCSKHKNYSFHQEGCDYALLRGMLINQKTDFVIAGVDDFPLSGLEYRVIREEQLYLGVSKEHRFADRTSITLAEAKDERFINLPESHAFRWFCDSLFQKAGIAYKEAITCDYTLRGKLVAENIGVVITTHSFMMQNMMGVDIVYIPITDSFAKRPLAIIWNSRHYLNRAALDFRDYVLSYGETPAAGGAEDAP